MLHNPVTGRTYYLPTYVEWLNTNKSNLHQIFRSRYPEIRESLEWRQQTLFPWIERIQNGYIALSKPKKQILPTTVMVEAFKEKEYHFDPQIIRDEEEGENRSIELKEEKKRKRKKKKPSDNMPFIEKTIDPHELHDFDEVDPETDVRVNKIAAERRRRHMQGDEKFRIQQEEQEKIKREKGEQEERQNRSKY
jgi:hypothetical protein